MLGKHKFRVGQRVRLSQYGKDSLLMPKSRRDAARGVVTKVDQFNSPTVLWDHQRTSSEYFAGFIEPIRKKRLAKHRSKKSVSRALVAR